MKLKRYPDRKNELLQAWDSADDLILAHLNTLELKGKRILILNDSFGALSCGLENLNISTYTDSFVSSKAIQLNSENKIQPLNELQALSGLYDFALIRIPKNMSYFEDMLAHLSQHLHPSTQVICGYMVKYQTKTSFDLLEKYIGKTHTSLAQKKSRLIFAKLERTQVNSPYPLNVSIEGFEKPFLNHSNLFSREKLDIGTRFFLSHLPEGNYKRILDLGCANGIIGIAAKSLNPSSEIIFSDESQMAIQSAMANYGKYFSPKTSGEAKFSWNHCCENQDPYSVDLVLCNPPFHQGNTISDFTALEMFRDAHRALKTGGTLRVIGNSHLKYQVTLKKLFGNSETVAKNSKFTIIDAVK